MGKRSFRKLHVLTVAFLLLAGCRSGGGEADTPTTQIEPAYKNNLSSDALMAFFVKSFDAFEDKATELRNSVKYQRQNIDWYIDANKNGSQDDGTEPVYNSYSLASARIEYAHAVGLTGQGQTISVVDDGFLTTHEAISNRILSESSPGGALTHGTAVASVAAGDSPFMIGVAPRASLLLGRFENAASRTNATNMARTAGAVVQNNSWGFLEKATPDNFKSRFVTGADQTYLAALREYTQNGIVVFAADNDHSATQSGMMEGLPRFAPELEPGWLAVISGVPDFDNKRILRVERISSACLEAARWCLVADGTWIAANANPNNQSYSLIIGTSFAAPVVSGAIALLAEAFPNLTPHDLRARLIATADNGFEGFTASGRLEVVPDSGFYHDYSEEWGHGFVDVRSALLPIGTPATQMADGSVQSVDQPLITGGGATGDAIALSLEAIPVLVTDVLGGDFTMPGEALAARAAAAPVSERLRLSMFDNASKSSLIRAYGGGEITLRHDTVELSILGLNAATGLSARAGSEPAIGAAIGQRLEAAGGELFIGLNVARDDGTVLPRMRGVSNTLAAFEADYTRAIGSAGFLKFGGTFGLSPSGSGGQLLKNSDVRFNAFRAKIGHSGVVRKGDRLSLGISMPVAVTSGSAQIALPVARGVGGISYRDVRVDYAPREREIDMSITYGTPLGRSSEMFVGAMYAFNHGHIGGQKDTAAILGFRRAF